MLAYMALMVIGDHRRALSRLGVNTTSFASPSIAAPPALLRGGDLARGGHAPRSRSLRVAGVLVPSCVRRRSRSAGLRRRRGGISGIRRGAVQMASRDPDSAPRDNKLGRSSRNGWRRSRPTPCTNWLGRVRDDGAASTWSSASDTRTTSTERAHDALGPTLLLRPFDRIARRGPHSVIAVGPSSQRLQSVNFVVRPWVATPDYWSTSSFRRSPSVVKTCCSTFGGGQSFRSRRRTCYVHQTSMAPRVTHRCDERRRSPRWDRRMSRAFACSRPCDAYRLCSRVANLREELGSVLRRPPGTSFSSSSFFIEFMHLDVP